MIMVFNNCVYIKDMIIYYRNENIVNFVDDKMIIKLRETNTYTTFFEGGLKHFSSDNIKKYIINKYQNVILSTSYDVDVREQVISLIFESTDFLSYECDFH